MIPFIESNYDPFSISPSGAVGLWQFMPTTGRAFNLERSWWNEDRHDPYRSTHAAIGYFKYLFERFDNDIYLALAAYNAGPTYLEKQIKKNKRRGLKYDFSGIASNTYIMKIDNPNLYNISCNCSACSAASPASLNSIS